MTKNDCAKNSKNSIAPSSIRLLNYKHYIQFIINNNNFPIKNYLISESEKLKARVARKWRDYSIYVI